MKVKYRIEVGGPSSRLRLKAFELVAPPAFCCADMRRSWGRLIDLGLYGFARTENLSVCLCTTAHVIQGGVPVAGVDLIAFCPWCGEAIELVDDAKAPAEDDNSEDDSINHEPIDW